MSPCVIVFKFKLFSRLLIALEFVKHFIRYPNIHTSFVTVTYVFSYHTPMVLGLGNVPLLTPNFEVSEVCLSLLKLEWVDLCLLTARRVSARSLASQWIPLQRLLKEWM